MIAKHIAMRSARRGSFEGLARYITSAHGKDERVGEVRTTNFAHDDVAGAVIEATLTQARNTRAAGDKTYHLVVSFRPGERPSPEALHAAEAALCDGLGFGEHQRISAVHEDTDNVHIHIAINKVHPTRRTLHEPFRDYWRIAEICAAVEQAHGLEVDNHLAAKRGGENRADDMAEASGIEPLRDWIRRTCLDELRAAPNWPALHAIAASNGLTIEARGVGLVITDSQGVAVKPSTVARDLSRVALEKRLGAFRPVASAAQMPPAQRRYEKRPVPTRVDTSALYDRYRRENEAGRTVRTEALREARTRRDLAIEAAKRRGRLERAVIKLGGPGRRVAYGVSSHQLKSAVDAAVARFTRDREAIGRAARPLTWADWLQAEARRGNAEALAALRARGRGAATAGDGVRIVGAASDATAGATAMVGEGATPRADSITKAGTIIFHSPEAAVRDDGARLSLSRGADDAGIIVALRMAQARYGDVLWIEGSAAFQQQVARVAAASCPAVRFGDAGLDQQRAAFARAGVGEAPGVEARPEAVPPAKEETWEERVARETARDPHWLTLFEPEDRKAERLARLVAERAAETEARWTERRAAVGGAGVTDAAWAEMPNVERQLAVAAAQKALDEAEFERAGKAYEAEVMARRAALDAERGAAGLPGRGERPVEPPAIEPEITRSRGRGR